MAFVQQSPMDALYGAFGNPTAVDRQRMYGQQQTQLRGSISMADQNARNQAARSAATAGAGGNPYLSGRIGAQAGADASQHIQSQGIQAAGQLGAQQTAQEIQAKQQQGQWAQNAIGGLLGAGGQVLGMAVPALGALGGGGAAAGLAGGLVGASPQSTQRGLGGLLGMGGAPQPATAPMQAPQAPTPQLGLGAGGFAPQGMTAPPGMRWDPMTNQWVPA